MPQIKYLSKHLSNYFLIGCVVCYSFNARAGYDEAVAAYQAKDYANALTQARRAADAGDARASALVGSMYHAGMGVTANPSEAVVWYDKAAKGGVPIAMSKLAQIYFYGEGVAKDADKALAYARQAAQLGDADGMLFVSTILDTTVLSYIDSSGKADNAKYRQLSTRSLSERTLDIEANDALYRASDKGNPYAILSLAAKFGSTIGDNNTNRMLELASKIPQHTFKPLQNREKLARYMNNFGQSLTSPKLFADAQNSQLMAAMFKTCGLQTGQDASKSAPVLTSTAIAKPLTDATYLPSNVPGYERAYLVAGEWEEDWTYKGCDKTATIRVKFSADGFGGARFASQQPAKDIPGVFK